MLLIRFGQIHTRQIPYFRRRSKPKLSAEEVAQIKRATEVDDEKEAVAKAVREFLRVAGLRELKAASGKVDYVAVGEEMEALELRESQPSQ